MDERVAGFRLALAAAIASSLAVTMLVAVVQTHRLGRAGDLAAQEGEASRAFERAMTTAIEERIAAERARDDALRRRDEAEAEADAARHAAVTSTRIAALLDAALAELDEAAAGHDTTMVRRLLGDAAARLDAEPGPPPAVERDVRSTLGAAYLGIDALDPAGAQLDRAAALPATDEAAARRAIDALARLATRLAERGRHEAAARRLAAALDAGRRDLGVAHERTRQLRLDLAEAAQRRGSDAEAERLLREAVDVDRAALGPEHAETIDAIHRLGRLLAGGHRAAEAEPALRHALDVARRRSFDPDLVSEYARHLGRLLETLGRSSEAEPLLREAANDARRRYGPRDVRLAEELMALGAAMLRQERFDEAEGVLRECLTIRFAKLPRDDRSVVEARLGLGTALGGQRRFREAETHLLDAHRTTADAHALVDARREAARLLAALYDAWGRHGAASQWIELIASGGQSPTPTPSPPLAAQ